MSNEDISDGEVVGFVVIACFLIFVCLIWPICNTAGIVETRLEKNARRYAHRNNIKIERIGCDGSSLVSSYGVCTLVTNEKEKIALKCPGGFVTVNIFRAKKCKEAIVPTRLNNSLSELAEIIGKKVSNQ